MFLPGHINNLYNTTFWAIVHSGKTETEAEEQLRVSIYTYLLSATHTYHWYLGHVFKGQA